MSDAVTRTDETIEQYHADKAWFSRSQLWDLHNLGPQVFFSRHIAGLSNRGEPSDAMIRGQIIHDWAEKGDKALAHIVTIPSEALGKDGRRTNATEEWEKTLATGQIGMKEADIASIRAQIEGMKANPMFGELVAATRHKEVSVRWRDSLTKIPLKCRPDAITDALLWDIKTTKEQAPLDGFWKSVVDFGYDLQAAMYLEGCRIAGMPSEKFVFLVTSTVHPYLCHAVTLPDRMIENATTLLRKLAAEVQNRIELDHWLPPDYGQITELSVPHKFLGGSNESGRTKALGWVS